MKTFLRALGARPELVIISMMAVVIAMLIVPLPPMLIDVLLGVNIVISLSVFVVSFYIGRVLDFSAFPSALLITTLFRLALTVSTSRMILLKADAGRIIESFGTFVIGGDVVVGMIIFVIVTLIQFIVITKGSERVAEVCARFSLDGMPGKQMSIDSDLRAGVIDADEARRKRSVLEKESQLYGSLDGAMKFIKGDAIAGIIIALVNFVGGIGIGTARRGLSFGDSLDIYTRLTIGDGLVAQIPALLIAVGAGFVVTRVAEEGHSLGQDLLGQLFGKSWVVLVVAVLCGAIGFVPGFPLPVFLALAGLLGLVYRTAKKRENAAAPAQAPGTAPAGEGGRGSDGAAKANGKPAGIDQLATETVPIMLMVGDGQAARMTELGLAERFRRDLFLDLGVKLPRIEIIESRHLGQDASRLLINEVPVTDLPVAFGKAMLVTGVDRVKAMGYALHETRGASGGVRYWVDADTAATLESSKIAIVRPDVDVLYRHVRAVLAKHIGELFGIQEAKDLLDAAEKRYPELVKETYRNTPVQRLAEILQRLLNEQVSIRNVKLVLEAVAYWSAKERDTLAVVEHVRTMLARYICNKLTHAGMLHVVTLSPLTEESIRRGIKQTASGAFLSLEPAEGDALLESVGQSMPKHFEANADLIMLTSADTRRFVKRLVESQYPDVEVISYGEISNAASINVIGTV